MTSWKKWIWPEKWEWRFNVKEVFAKFIALCQNKRVKISHHKLQKKLTIYFQKGQIGSYGNDYDDGGAFEKGLSQKMDHGGQKMI